MIGRTVGGLLPHGFRVLVVVAAAVLLGGCLAWGGPDFGHTLVVANDRDSAIVVIPDPPFDPPYEQRIGPGGDSLVSTRLEDGCTIDDVVILDAETRREVDRIEAGLCLDPTNGTTVRIGG